MKDDLKVIKQRYLNVFDYYSGQVYQTDLTEHFTLEDFHNGIDIEKFLWECEFEVNNCHYMVGEYKNIEQF